MTTIKGPVLTPLFLSLDSINWLDTVAKTLSRQRKTEVSRSEAADYVFRSHFIKTMGRQADQKFADRVGDRLKGTKLFTRNGEIGNGVPTLRPRQC